MPVKIKRVYDDPSPGDGRRILVDRLWPRGVKKETAQIDDWLKQIAPSHELRKWYNHDGSKWAEFQMRYQVELATEEKTNLVETLARYASNETITLLFAAKDEKHNNAVVLKNSILNQ